MPILIKIKICRILINLSNNQIITNKIINNKIKIINNNNKITIIQINFVQIIIQ